MAQAKKIKQAAGAADATGVSGSASVASAGAVDPDEEMAPGVDEAPPGEPTLVNVDAMKACTAFPLLNHIPLSPD